MIYVSFLEPVPLRNDWSSPLTSAKDDCSVIVFYHSQDLKSSVNNMEYSETLKTNWNTLCSDIEGLLETNEYGKYGLSVGILEKAFEVPELFTIDKFFSSSNSYQIGSKIMTLVVSSFEECKTKI